MTTIGSQAVGTGGNIIIDDDGYNVRFYLSQSVSATFINSPGKSWSGYINGVNVGGTWTWASGGGTRLIAGPYAVTYTQSISFGIGATGTQGFGGGGTAYATAYRATVPGTPGTPVASEITPTSMRLSWSIPGNGGSAIDQMLLRRSASADLAGGYTDYPFSGGTTTAVIDNLTPATTYYWRVYAHNGVGYSAQSGVTPATTASGAYASINGVWVPVPVYASDGSAPWNVPELLSSDGTAPWNPAL
ncbi:fibronectin type III domain-containing protein [Microbacterium hydrocarbonoxydans]|uniref:fibronectin type III domain-containing protein n=1 Tax=Microbacterium hydrocarbonoxydans TaxID=273678 RepID=UPI003D97132F